MMEKSRKKLPAGWEMKTLGEVCKLVRGPFGGSLKKENFVESGYAVYEQQHAINNQFSDVRYFIDDNKFAEMKRFELYPKDLIMSCSGTMGKVAIVPDNIERGIINQALLKITTNSQLNARYLKYYISSENFQAELAKYSQGVAIKNVASVPILKSTLIPIPSFSEQQRIVAKLDKAFAEIAAVKANIERNLQNCKEVFQSELNAVFANKGKDWNEKRFDEVCVLQRGFDLPAQSREGGLFPLVSSNGITDRINNWKVKAPGVVTGRSGSIGNVHFIQEDFWPLNTALYIKDFHGNDERCVFYLLKQLDLGKFSSGTGVPTLNRNNVHCVKIYFPNDKKEQQLISKKLDMLSIQTDHLEHIYKQKLSSLEELKKSILQKAFSGEL